MILIQVWIFGYAFINKLRGFNFNVKNQIVLVLFWIKIVDFL